MRKRKGKIVCLMETKNLGLVFELTANWRPLEIFKGHIFMSTIDLRSFQPVKYVTESANQLPILKSRLQVQWMNEGHSSGQSYERSTIINYKASQYRQYSSQSNSSIVIYDCRAFLSSATEVRKPSAQFIICTINFYLYLTVVVVAQLAKQSFMMPKDPDSNPAMGNSNIEQ